MKIAVVNERIEPWRGGAETSTMELTRLLRARGHDVHILTNTTAQSLPDITIHRIPANAMIRPLRTASFVRRVTAFLQDHPYDIVHAISPLPIADIYQPRGGLLRETMERNVATRKTPSRRLLKRALMAMDVKQRGLLELERRVFQPDGPVIAAVSNYVARQCERIYHVTPPRVRVVFNGVNVPTIESDARAALRSAIRAEYHIADDTLVLLFIAHNFRLKGLYPLLEVLSRLVVSGFKKFHLLVVGRDNVVPFQRRIHTLGLESYATFTGPTKRATSFFFGADVCVHPTYYDPCSRVVLESLAYGLPTITTSFNGAAEVIQDGREGFVIDTPENIGLWARRIEDLSSTELRTRMSENAAKVRDKITMERHVAELDALFAEVADRKGVRA